MSNDYSFDIVSKVNMQEVDNAVNQAMKEILNRFDFKGTKSQIIFNKELKDLTIISDDEYKLKSVIDVLESKLIKRGVPIKSLDFGKIEPAGGSLVRQIIKTKEGIEQSKAKEIVKTIKETGIKVSAQIMDDLVRVTSRNKDDLQLVMKMLQGKNLNIPLQFTNYR
ncbi:MAG: YajQ family cyclic di-GMP-binding protein [Candidatus Firestonebacteria bacterium]